MKHPTHPLREPDPDDPPSDEELAEAAILREALSDPAKANVEADLARALSLAHNPRPLADDENALLVEQSLAVARLVTSLEAVRQRRARRSRIVVALAAVAVAAGVMLFRAPSGELVASLDEMPLPARLRSAQPLFHEPFATTGGTSARIDRIASARAADLRENMFAAWDVR